MNRHSRRTASALALILCVAACTDATPNTDTATTTPNGAVTAAWPGPCGLEKPATCTTATAANGNPGQPVQTIEPPPNLLGVNPGITVPGTVAIVPVETTSTTTAATSTTSPSDPDIAAPSVAGGDVAAQWVTSLWTYRADTTLDSITALLEPSTATDLLAQVGGLVTIGTQSSVTITSTTAETEATWIIAGTREILDAHGRRTETFRWRVQVAGETVVAIADAAA